MSDANSTAQIEYRQIERFVGYRFGSDGSVWSQWYAVCRNRHWVLGDTWKKLKLSNRTGRFHYRGLSLRTTDGNFKDCSVHRLIAEAFFGPRPQGLVVCHNNGDYNDDRACNLRYDTVAANVQDSFRHGTMLLGEQKPNAKLTREDVLEIRRRVACGESQRAIADEHNVDRSLISRIASKTKWKWLA